MVAQNELDHSTRQMVWFIMRHFVRCWLGSRKGIRPIKNWVVGAGMVVCLGQGADLHMDQLDATVTHFLLLE